MKLQPRTIKELAEMICGQDYGLNAFQYRSSSKLTDFFSNCNLPYVHDGSTRAYWTREVLGKLNDGISTNIQLPSDSLIKVIQELLEPTDFTESDPDRINAWKLMNKSIQRDSLEVYKDGSKKIHIRNLQNQSTSAGTVLNKRILSEEEIKEKLKLEKYLSNSSEDEIIENVLLPLFRQLGFLRISLSGHKDKALEYGKDIWMKYQLPTMHYIYFGVQVKKGKIDSSGKSNGNIGEILNQITMMLDSPVWDPETNKKHLLDHMFIVSAGEITKQAKNFLAEKLDIEARRRIIFLSKEDIVNIAISINFLLRDKIKESADINNINPEDIPF